MNKQSLILAGPNGAGKTTFGVYPAGMKMTWASRAVPLALTLALGGCGSDEAVGKRSPPAALDPCTPETCEPQTLVEGLSFPVAIVVDDVRAYFLDQNDVLAVPLGGGSVESVAMGQGLPTSLALDADYLYWTNFTEGTIRRTPSDGETPEELVSGLSYPQALAVAGGNVYWVNSPGYPDSVWVMKLDGAEPTVLYTGSSEITSIAADGRGAYFSEAGDPETPGTGRLQSASPAGDEVVTLADDLASPRSVTVLDGSLYWVTGDSADTQALWTMPTSGGTPTALLEGIGVDELAVDASGIFFATTTTAFEPNGALSHLPLAGGEPTLMVAGVAQSFGIALARDFVYWVDAGPLLSVFEGTLMRVPKSPAQAP